MKSKPQLKFSRWYKWDERTEIQNLNNPGIYAIAITSNNLSGKKFDYGKVDYIGMSNSKGGLNSRLNGFNRAIHGNKGHSGGRTIFGDLGTYRKWKGKKLFVSVVQVKCNTEKASRTHRDLINMGWVAFLEYEAMAEFKKRLKREPHYNKK